MNTPERITLARRLNRLRGLIGALAALLTITGTAVNEWRDRIELRRDRVEGLARIIGEAIKPALVFDAPEAVRDTLALLATSGDIVHAQVRRADGRLVAEYRSRDPLPNLSSPRYLGIDQALEIDGEAIARISLYSDLSSVYLLIAQQCLIAAGASALAFTVAVLLGRRMLRQILAPVENLHLAMSRVRDGNDYTLRAAHTSNDEIGALTEGFNAMLDEIGRRDSELRQHRRNLELEVAARTNSLNEANTRLIDELAERRRLDDQLRLAAQVVDSSAEGILITDAERRIISINAAFTRVTGYTLAEVEGRNPRLLSSGRHSADFYRAMWETIYRTDVWQGEIWNRRKSGEEYPEWLTITVARDANGQVSHYIGMFSDMTERKAEEKQRLEEVIRQRDLLIREVHHRIKNNLQGVAGLLRVQGDAVAPNIVPAIEAATLHVRTVAAVYGIRGQSASGSIPLAELLATISRTTAELTHSAVETRLPPADGPRAEIVEAEVVPVALVVNELIYNAVKHSARDGARGTVSVELNIDPGQARIAIRNPGRLPEGFDFVKGEKLGTGLGLVKSLLPRSGVNADLVAAGDEVITDVRITPPVVEIREVAA
jgi:PAS domain S-box-containing protein